MPTAGSFTGAKVREAVAKPLRRRFEETQLSKEEE
jgi:hypothetical protein